MSEQRIIRNALVPMVVEQTPNGERGYDIYSRLLKDRIIVLGEDVNPITAGLVIAQMLYLDADNPDKEISFYIMSPGGYVTAGLAIYDVMQYVKAPVATICMGQAASMGAVLLCGGTKGMRYVMPNAEVMIHQVAGGTQGQATDIMIEAKHIDRMKERLNRIIAAHTGQPFEKVVQDAERNNYMTAEEAVKYGLADEILAKGEEPPKK